MYDQNELDALAKDARMKLSEQRDTHQEGVEPEDIYKGLFDDEDYDNEDYQDYENKDEDGYSEEVYENDTPNLVNERISLDQYDRLLFDGGPTLSQVNLWRKEWDGYDICVCEIHEQSFVFRTLNRFEYKQLVALKNVDALQREEIVCETVTLWPVDIDWSSMASLKAGIPSTYSEIIMEKSGFTTDYAVKVI